jgi:flagellar L-ring protein precursor FlgH
VSRFMNHNEMSIRVLAMIVASSTLGGCMSNRAMPNRVNDFSPVMPQTVISDKVIDGSIYSGGMNDGLFGDRKAYRVGDLITILLRESTAAEKSADNSVSRSTSNDALSPLQLGKIASPGGFPFSTDSTLGSNISNDGSGSTSQTNLITLTNGDEYVQVSGVIRPDDIQPDNTILSKRIANAQITYSGNGQINDAMKMPSLASLFLKYWIF